MSRAAYVLQVLQILDFFSSLDDHTFFDNEITF